MRAQPTATSGGERRSNLELFRIVAMLLIMLHHYVVSSGLTAAGGVVFSAPLSWRGLLTLELGAWGKTGINCFLLLTGYFMCQSRITAPKFFRLLLEMMFYRIVIYLIFLLSGYEPFSLRSLILTLVPITHIGTNFAECYLMFYLCIPFLNALLQSLTERQHARLLALCAVIYVALGTLHRTVINYVSWFSMVYLLAAYLRLYPKKLYANTRFWTAMTVVCAALSAASVAVCTWLGVRWGRVLSYYFVEDSNSLLPVLTAVSALMLFLNMRVRQSRLINWLAGSIFGVLCIHAGNDVMKHWLWRDGLNNVGFYPSPWMPLHAVGSVALVFLLCTLIDKARIRLLEQPLFRRWDRWGGAAVHWYARLEDRLFPGEKNREKTEL